MIDRVPVIDIHSDAGEKPASVKGDLALHGVGFAYPARPEAQIFSDLDLEIPAGKQ